MNHKNTRPPMTTDQMNHADEVTDSGSWRYPAAAKQAKEASQQNLDTSLRVWLRFLVTVTTLRALGVLSANTKVKADSGFHVVLAVRAESGDEGHGSYSFVKGCISILSVSFPLLRLAAVLKKYTTAR